MVIREIVEALEREIQQHKAALRRLEAVKGRILTCCRTPPEDKEPCQDGKLKKAA